MEAKSALSEKVKLIATIIGIASPILALFTFIGFKPEKKKQLEWEYVSKSSLVNPSTPATEKIEILYDGRKIRRLTAISARLTNSGSVPIDGSDVKDGAFPAVIFPIEIISAEVKSVNRNGIKASAKVVDKTVQIEHGLLNPSDSIAIQILLDGDLEENGSLPPVNYRIVGIEEPSTRFPTAPAQRIGVAYFRFSRAIEYIIIFIASIGELLFFALLAAGIQDALKSVLSVSKFRQIRSQTESLSFADGLDPQARVAIAYYRLLPSPYDQQARDLVNSLPLHPSETPAEYTKRTGQFLEERLVPRTLTSILWAKKGIIFGLTVLTVIAVCTGLLLIGSWYQLIPGQ